MQFLDFDWPANILAELNFRAQENRLMSPDGVYAVSTGPGWARDYCDGKFNDKNFNNNNAGQFVLPHPSFTRNQCEIHLNCIFFFAINLYHHSQFLDALDFINFFTLAILNRAAPFFLQSGCFCVDITSFVI